MVPVGSEGTNGDIGQVDDLDEEPPRAAPRPADIDSAAPENFGEVQSVFGAYSAQFGFEVANPDQAGEYSTLV